MMKIVMGLNAWLFPMPLKKSIFLGLAIVFAATPACTGCANPNRPGEPGKRPAATTTSVSSPTSTSAVGRDESGEIVRDAQIWSGSGADAACLGWRQAATPVIIHEIVGQRAHIFERKDPKQASWLDLNNLALSFDAWSQLRPSPIRTTIGIAAPSGKTVTPAVWEGITREAGAFLDRFLEVGSPGAEMLLRTDYGSAAARMDITVPSLVKPQMTEPGPKPSIYDGPAYEKWKKRMEERLRQEQEYSDKVAKARQTVEAQIAELKKFQLPATASVTGAVLQIERELRQAAVPAVTMVLLVNPVREAMPAGPLPELKGIRVSVVVACDAGEVACRSGETRWQQLLSEAGVLGVPQVVDAQSAHLPQAFEPIVPVIR